MTLTPAQQATLKADVLTAFPGAPATPDGAEAIATAYALVATPDYWVWRSALTEREVVESPGPEGTVWSWSQYIARTEPERDAWKRLFASGVANPSLPNVRQGVADIFSGAQAGPVAQRAHLLATARRKATRAEKLFATGAGTPAAPSTLGAEGALTGADVLAARGLP